MISQKKPKWSLEEDIRIGQVAVQLATENKDMLNTRLKPGYIDDLTQSVEALKTSQSGQAENIVSQKSKTQAQDEEIKELHTNSQDIKNMVKAVTSDKDILKAFGVGEKYDTSTVSGAVAEVNIIVNGYNQYKEWANSEARILDEDIAELTSLRDSLVATDNVQESAKLVRKEKTLDKNTLQRQVEDMVTHLSALGVRLFRKTDPAKMKLFEDLIP